MRPSHEEVVTEYLADISEKLDSIIKLLETIQYNDYKALEFTADISATIDTINRNTR